MLEYPNKPGHRGVDTSIQAGEAFTPHLGNCQRDVYQVIHAAGPNGATGDEIAAQLDWNPYAVRPRTSELRKLGRIIDSGKRRPNCSGRYAIVWIVPCFAAGGCDES